jgi:hypothetical protein
MGVDPELVDPVDEIGWFGGHGGFLGEEGSA